MMAVIKRSGIAAMPLVLLSACGGGGGVSSTPTPSTSSTTTTTPTTTPASPAASTTPVTTVPTINYDDSEYRRSNAAVVPNALAAYQKGATGAGVTIGFVDSGISDPSGQFTGRISSASADLVSNRGLADVGGHGTSVAAVAAAGRNGTDIMGVAFDATLLIARTDAVGSCVSSTGCSHSDPAIAQGIDLARQAGARVINISLGGSAASSPVVQAVNRATAAGIIIVISAGNDTAIQPDDFAHVASTGSANGLVIIAGGHDENGLISSFSNRAGGFASYYLTALGTGVRSFDHTGSDFFFSGTSYAAPAIAGAVALLAQAFPNLTGQQIVSLLYSSATDAGDAGVDAVYGRGLLSLTKAFQPQGSTSLAGSAVPVSLTNNATLGSAMGDAAQTGSSAGQAIFLDGYDRAYTLNLSSTLGQAAISRPLTGALASDIRRSSLARGPIAVSVGVERGMANRMVPHIESLNVGPWQARQAKLLSAHIVARIDQTTKAAFSLSEGASALASMIDGREAMPFLVARGTESSISADFAEDMGLVMRREVAGFGVSLLAEQGRIKAIAGSGARASAYQQAGVRVDRAVGPLRLSLDLTMLNEAETVLGSRFSAALGGRGAQSQFVGARAAWAFGEGWQIAASARQGWTQARTAGLVSRGALASNAFALDLSRSANGERYGLRVAQPLRVASGGYLLNLPTSYDYASGSVGYALEMLDLAPKGREIDVEAAYGRAVGDGWIDANLFWRSQPGNIAAAPDDIGAAVRFNMGF